jgi:hypothetical protein
MNSPHPHFPPLPQPFLGWPQITILPTS